MRPPVFTLAGAALAAGFLAAYFAVATTVGFDGPPADWRPYGEPPVPGPVRQPIAFWTDLAFVLAGLAVLLRLDRAPRDAGLNPMARPTPYSVGLGLVIVWMGPGSMLEHGTLTSTWGWFDASSIHWLALFVTGYLLLRWVPGAAGSRRGAALFWCGQALAWTAVGLATWSAPGLRQPASIALLVVMGALVLASLVAGRRVGLRFGAGAWPAFARAGVALALAIALLRTGGAGGATAPWGHGAWHVCAALSLLCLHDVLRAEQRDRA